MEPSRLGSPFLGRNRGDPLQACPALDAVSDCVPCVDVAADWADMYLLFGDAFRR